MGMAAMETWMGCRSPFWPRLLGFGSPHRHSWPRVFWKTLVKIGKRMAEICWDHWLYNMINEHHMISTDIICLEGVIEWLSEQTWKSRGDMSHWNIISIEHLNDDVAFKFSGAFQNLCPRLLSHQLQEMEDFISISHLWHKECLVIKYNGTFHTIMANHVVWLVCICT